MNLLKIIILFFTSFFISLGHADASYYLKKIKKDPNALYAFFKKMPKGGELHYHLAGGPFPETMLKIAAKESYCIDRHSLSISKELTHCLGIPSKELSQHPHLYDAIIKEWSMKDFVPGKHSGHDHFFASFNKFMPLIFDHRIELLADVIQRAGQQHELYLEIMAIPDNAHSSSFGHLISGNNSFGEKKQLLLNNKEFQNNITHTIEESERVVTGAYEQLDCPAHPQQSACAVRVKLLYYVLREQGLDRVFAQALNAFEAASRSKGSIVGVNLVQPEDGLISLRDYHQQMLIFNYLHGIYPKVNISLHAGELAPESVTPEELGYHIHDAVLTGKAQRIGHGVSIAYENKAHATVKYMAKHHIPVEINLISNQKILNVSGANHPLHYYLTHQVPMVLSTDDEGILRTDLTRQYVEAALIHNLDYSHLKQMNRNTLTYAFIPGKSIWNDANKNLLVSECQDLNSKTCQHFIEQSEKAKLQWNLEQKLIQFEQQF